MAKKYVNIGPFGPFIFDDNTDDGVETDGDIVGSSIKTTGLTSNVRLLFSNANQEVSEVNDLTPYLNGGNRITVTDDGDGTVTIAAQNLSALSTIDDTDSPFTALHTNERNYIIADATNGAITVNLPPAADWTGLEIIVKKLDSAANNVTVSPDGTETIDGAGSYDLVNQWDTVTLYSDGSQVLVISAVT